MGQQSSVSAPYIRVAVINESTLYTDAQVQACVNALQLQITRDFAPFWGVNCTLVIVPKTSPAPKGYWQLVFLDNSDQANALGYHDITAEELPLGKVFVASDIQAGASVEVTASHELMEMLVDPEINLCVVTASPTPNNNLRLVAYEVGDPVEDDQFGYLINNLRVSDFVTPAYFTDSPPVDLRLDFGNHITKSYQLLSGGYLAILDASSALGWQQISAQADPDKRKYRELPVPGSRRERRMRGRANWMMSTKAVA